MQVLMELWRSRTTIKYLGQTSQYIKLFGRFKKKGLIKSVHMVFTIKKIISYINKK